MLENILNELQRKNPQKWETVTLDELFSEYLICGQMLMKETNLKEIGIILLELRCITGCIWHTNDMLKAEKVNAIVTAFGGTNFAEVKRCGKKIHNPDSLLLSCTNVIKGNDFHVKHIQIPLASLLQIEERRKWCENTTVPLTCHVPGGHINFFSYPELNTLRAQLEFHTFDFTHILTNLHTQILTRGLDYCKKEHFEHLSEDRPDILSLSLVFDRIDQQNAFTAMRMFNESIESYMHTAGFTDTANFVQLIRNWHDACNKRGIPADTRVRYLHDMHQFLTEGINFNAIPFQYPGRYIKGLTWQTFEALLQNISTRIQLYFFTSGGTYNSRAVSTLSNESFFADLVRYDKESHGYPKGTNVSRVFGRVVLINHFKHKRDKNYYLAATVKAKYEVQLAEPDNKRYLAENELHFNGVF